MTQAVSGPLNGLKILDLTHVWAGPLAVRFLADLGAEVVQVEAPQARGPRQYPSTPMGGWLGGEPGEEPWNVNAMFNKLHRNRQSLCIDLKQAQGRDILLSLVAHADVLIENFSARAMQAMGLGYEVLKQANPKIVYVTMPGFGSSGPYRDRVAFGPIIEGMTGLSTMLGYDGETPMNSAMALMDPVAATHAAAALTTAIRRRDQLDQSVFVDLSLHEGGVALSGPWLIDYQLGHELTCLANRHPNMAPHGIYPCLGEDQWVALACTDSAQWASLCSEIPSLNVDMDLSQRQQAYANIDTIIAAWTLMRSKQEAVGRLQAIGVPAGAVNTAADIMLDEQVQAREYFVPYEQFDTPMPGNPMRMAGLDTSQWTPCPSLGADNESVLSDWLGLQLDDLETLSEQGVLMKKPPN